MQRFRTRLAAHCLLPLLLASCQVARLAQEKTTMQREQPFHVYAPSRSTQSLLVVRAVLR